jgi:uncharacterized protein YjbI with pentapeptide repeats
MKAKDLIARWDAPPTQAFLPKLVRVFHDTGNPLLLEYSPFGLVGDKVDLRGINLTRKEVINCLFKNVDFSHATFEDAWVKNTKFTHCNFYKVNFTQLRDLGNQFSDCWFMDCKFNHAGLGYAGTPYRNCIFEKCNFMATRFTRPEYTNVVFKNCKIKRVDFEASSFEDVVFEETVLDDVWFRGGFPLASMEKRNGRPRPNQMKNVEFKNSEVLALTISDNCDLSTVKLDNEKYYKYDDWKMRLEFLLAQLEQWGDNAEKKEARLLAEAFLIHAENQQWYIINIEELEKRIGKSVATRIVKTLKEATS